MNNVTTVERTPEKRIEDPLGYLPCSTILDFRKNQEIYNLEQPSTCLYLVISGKVSVFRTATGLGTVLVDIYQSDEFFAESSLVGAAPGEVCAALENTQVMTWTASEIENIAVARPKLALAFLQLIVQRNLDFVSRIESFATDNIERRLARTLIRFAEKFGHQAEDGFLHMIPLSQQLLAQYVGTSREIVTHYMNQFRREGYLRYSRQGIQLSGDALKEVLNLNLVDNEALYSTRVVTVAA